MSAGTQVFPIVKAMGSVTLAAGTNVVTGISCILSTDKILLSYTGALSAGGQLTTGTIVAGTGFTITSSNGSDASTVLYVILGS